MSLVSFLVWLLVLCLVFGILYWIIGSLIPVPQPIRTIALAILALVFVLLLVSALFGGLTLPALSVR